MPEVNQDQPPVESFALHVLHFIKAFVLKLKEILPTLLIVLILLGILYNFFAKDDKDIPEEAFQKLYKLLTSAGGVMPRIGGINDEKWVLSEIKQNYTVN